MANIKTNWAPFPIEYSSCSKFTPKAFRWSKTEGIADVYIDRSIMDYRGGNERAYGWFCESSEILPDLKSYLISNSHSLSRNFKKIFTCDYSIIKTNPDFFLFNPPGSNLPWTPFDSYGIPEKSKLCSMISSSKDMTTGQKKRLEFASLNIGKIDIYGGAHGTSRIGQGIGPNNDWWRSKEDALAPYMFSVVFENAAYSNYYTEKITDCFALGVIPIYWGSPDIGQEFDSNGIVFLEEIGFDISCLSKELYDSKKDSIVKNLEKVKELDSADDSIYKKILEWN
jgi:hypothetical protein